MSVGRISRPNAAPDSRGRRLESWKEIAVYLGRDVTTVRRWERREGLPVSRILHSKIGSVYAYTTELDAWRDSRAPVAATDVADVHPVPEIDAQRIRVARRWFVVSGVAILALLVVAYFATRSRLRGATGPKIRSLAVLPLKNLSGDPTQEYLADGMTEALIGRLSSIHDLRVISRTSAMQFKNSSLSVPEIARTLHVDAIVEGSVIRDASRIRVHAQLIRAATDEHFWSETYDRELGDALGLESDVAQTIAGRVEVTVTGAERARLVAARQVSADVYENFLKGQFVEKSNRPAATQKSIAYFEEAIKRDPAFAPAYLGLAQAYAALGTPGVAGAPPNEVQPKVISAVRRALELDPALPGAHDLIGNLYQMQWQWNDAEREYKLALELDPNDAGAHLSFSNWLLSQGRTEEALAWSRRARELDPIGITGNTMGWILFQSRHYDEAIRELRGYLAVRHDDASTYWSCWFLGFALIANGQPDEAIPVLEKALALSDRNPAVIGVLVRAYAHAGRRADALRLLDELKRRQQKGYVPTAAFVNAYLGLGDNEQAFAWLERAYKEHSTILMYIKVHPFFDPLRGDPRLADLVRRVGLDQAR
jgi:TolB-like protein/tetratricopeptide (TPR) repeat protein